MKSIIKWMDVAEFAGQIVAYTTTSYYLGDKRLPGFPDVSLGYIGAQPSHFQLDDVGPEAGEECYSMDKLLPKKAVPCACAIAPEFLGGAELQMRRVTDEEVVAIHALLDTEQAEFCYGGGPASAFPGGRNNPCTLKEFQAICTVAAWLGANATRHRAARQQQSRRVTVNTEYGLTTAQVECAVKWWARHLQPEGETEFESGGTDRGNLFAKALAADLNQRQRARITPDQIKDFSILLGEFLESFSPYYSLTVDYSPCRELNLSLRRAGIKPGLATFPWKTSMYFSDGGVQVNNEEILLVDAVPATS